MADKESQLRLRLTAENQASPAFEALTTAAQAMRTTIEQAVGSLGGTFQSIANAASPLTDVARMANEDTKAIGDMAKGTGESTKAIEQGFSELGQTMSAAVLSIRQGSDDIVKSISGLNKAETAVNGLKKSIDGIGGLMSLQVLGQSLEGAGKSGEKLFDYAITQGSDFQQSMQNINTVLAANVTGNENWNQKMQDSAGLTQQLQDLALGLGSRGAQSANEVAAAVDAMLRGGVDGKTILEGAAKAAQDVAIVTGDKLDESANLVTEIFHLFREQFAENGKSVKENMTDVGDVLTGTLLSARINSNDFITTLKYVGPVASQLSSNFDDVATATALLAQNGIKGSSAGTALRRAITNLLEPTKSGAQAMTELGLIQNGHNKLIDESTGKMKSLTEIQGILHQSLDGLTEAKKAQYIHDIFGQYAMAGSLVLANQNSEAYQHLKEKIDGVTASDAAASMLDTFSGHMRQLEASVSTTAKEFGLSLIPSLEKLLPIGNQMLSWLRELTPANKEFLMGILGVGSALAVAGGALTTFAVSLKFAKEGAMAIKDLFMVQTAAGEAITVFQKFAVAVREVGVAEAFMDAMSPMGWIVLIGAAVAGAAMLIMQHWGQIQPWLQRTWSAISDAAQASFNAVLAFFKKWGLDILAGILGPIGILALEVYRHWDQIKSYTSTAFTELTTGVQNIWTGFKTWISDAVHNTVQAIVDAFKWLYDHNYYFKDLVDSDIQVFTFLREKSIEIFNAIKSFLSTTWSAISTDASAAWTAFSNTVQSLWNGAMNALTTIFSPAETFLSGLWTGISNTAQTMWSGIRTNLSVLFQATVNDGEGIFNSLGSFFTGLWNQAEQWGANLIHMVATGITNAAHEVYDAAKGVADNIVHWLGFHSPSAGLPDSDQYAPNFVRMFSSGLSAGADQVGQAAETLISPLTDVMSSLGGGGVPGGFSNDQLTMQKDLANQIIQQKQIWEDASKRGDQAAMDSANKMADQYRAQLDKMGGDSKKFSADTSVQDAIKNVQQIAQQISAQIATDYGKMTTSISDNLKTVSTDTTTYNTDMLHSWTDTNAKTADSVVSTNKIITDSITQLNATIKDLSQQMAASMEISFDSIATGAQRMADEVIAAANAAKAALSGLPGSNISVNSSVNQTSSPVPFANSGSMMMAAPAVRNGDIHIHGGININGANKDGNDLGKDIMKALRIQTSFAL